MEIKSLENRLKRYIRESAVGRPHCRFISFDDSGPVWEVRVALRNLLVEDLEKSFGDLSGDGGWRERLLKPGNRPHLPDVAISLSHCPSLGGFIFSAAKNFSLGFDVEEASRVDRAVEYLARVEEIGSSPSRALLWVAKEAAFKAVAPVAGRRHLLGDILISRWKKKEEGGYGFRFFTKGGTAEGVGGAFLAGRFALGCARC